MSTAVEISFDPCPVCDGCEWTFARDLDEVHKFKLFRCASCGHIMQNPIPSDGQLAEAYSDFSYKPYQPAWKEDGWPIWKILRLWTTRRRISLLKRYGRGERMLEVGAGAGDFLASAIKAGWGVKAVEYNAEMCGAIRGEFGVDIRAGQLTEKMWPRASFDLVAMWNVLEHLQHPQRDLEIVSAYLRDGGRILLNIPTRHAAEGGKGFGFHWELLSPPEHINFFDRNSLSRLCAKFGLRVIAYKTPFVQSAWCYYMSAVNMAKGSNGRLVFVAALITVALPCILFEAINHRGTEAFAVLEKNGH